MVQIGFVLLLVSVVLATMLSPPTIKAAYLDPFSTPASVTGHALGGNGGTACTEETEGFRQTDYYLIGLTCGVLAVQNANNNGGTAVKARNEELNEGVIDGIKHVRDTSPISSFIMGIPIIPIGINATETTYIYHKGRDDGLLLIPLVPENTISEQRFPLVATM